MGRAILSAAMLLLAGCNRPAPHDRADEPAHPGGPTAARSLPADGPAAGPPEVAASPDSAAGPERPPATDLIPDPTYTPREEDRVNLVADATPAFARASGFDEAFGSPGPGDPALLQKLSERGEMVELEGRLPVLVLRNLDPADVREPGRHYSVEVRILAGPRRGESWFVDESAVARLVPKVNHPPLAPGSYATVAGPGTIAYAGWEAFDPASRGAGEAASRESSRLAEGARVMVQEVRGEAVRVRIDADSGAARYGVVARSDLRPMMGPSAAPDRPAAGR